MDTKYWGPSGWKFLHLITFAEEHPSAIQKKNLECFFSTLPYVLPCKFCRASLSEYVQTYPIDKAISSTEPYAVAKWLWKIHNCVNDKLRNQKLLTHEKDPPFKTVKDIYVEKFNAGCTRTKFEGWEFLFSVVESHPYSKQSLSSIPMEGAPDVITGTLEKNKWNVLPAKDRFKLFKQFWNCLPDVLPYKEWKDIWLKCSDSIDWSSRKSSLKTLWGIRCAIDSQLKLLNNTNYYSLCRELRTHRSGCSKSRRARTCRKNRSKDSALKTFRKKRETR